MSAAVQPDGNNYSQMIQLVCAKLTFTQNRKVFERSLRYITDMSDEVLNEAIEHLADQNKLKSDERELILDQRANSTRSARCIRFVDIVKTKDSGLQCYVAYLSQNPDRHLHILKGIWEVVNTLYPTK